MKMKLTNYELRVLYNHRWHKFVCPFRTPKEPCSLRCGLLLKERKKLEFATESCAKRLREQAS